MRTTPDGVAKGVRCNKEVALNFRKAKHKVDVYICSGCVVQKCYRHMSHSFNKCVALTK